MADEPKELIVAVDETEDRVPVVVTDTAKLMQIALQGDASIEMLERLIDLKNSEEERGFKRDFDFHFAEMQREFKPVKRDKKGDKGKYAPLDSLQKRFGPVIATHGFSYRWSEESLPEGRLRVRLSVSGYGYTQENYKDLPAYVPDTGGSSGKPIMNILQAEGARSTYGQRYTFIAGFGLIIEDADDDGMSFDDGLNYGEYIKTMEAETHLDDLQATAKKIRAELRSKGDERGVKIITNVYLKRKDELT